MRWYSSEERMRFREGERQALVFIFSLGAILYGVIMLGSMLFGLLTAGETQYEVAQRLGQRAPGTIEEISSRQGNEYRVYVSFQVDRQRRGSYVTIVDRDDKLTIPSDVTVIYLPTDRNAIYIEDYGDPRRSPSVDKTPEIFKALAFILGGVFAIWFMTSHIFSDVELPRLDAP